MLPNLGHAFIPVVQGLQIETRKGSDEPTKTTSILSMKHSSSCLFVCLFVPLKRFVLNNSLITQNSFKNATIEFQKRFHWGQEAVVGKEARKNKVEQISEVL